MTFDDDDEAEDEVLVMVKMVVVVMAEVQGTMTVECELGDLLIINSLFIAVEALLNEVKGELVPQYESFESNESGVAQWLKACESCGKRVSSSPPVSGR